MQTDTLCLGLLSSGPKSGYEIKQIFTGPLSDIYSLSFGTIYPSLSKLMDQKFVTCKQHTQEKKPDKKVYTITKKGLEYFKQNIVADATSYIRLGNYGDQIKSEFLLLILFSNFMPKEITNTVINERVLYAKQKLELIKYKGPLPPEIESMRRKKSADFIMGLAAEVIEAGLNYIEKNKGKLIK